MNGNPGCDPQPKETDRIREYLESIIALMPGHVYWKDKTGVILGCNDLQAKSAGLSSRKDMVGKTDHDLPWKEQAEALRKIDSEVMETGQPQTVEEISILADGTEAVFLSKKVPLYHDSEIVGIVGISFDITEQRKSEKKLRETEGKLEGMTFISASMAHELRTPLSSLHLSIRSFKDILPSLVQTYEIAQAAHLPIPPLQPAYLDLLQRKIASMDKEIKASFTFIDMLLMNLTPSLTQAHAEVFCMKACVEEALSRYPLSTEQKTRLHWVKEEQPDFALKGERLWMIHVLFNLMKNALHAVLKAGKGDLYLWIECQSDHNTLYFKDTGTGIAAPLLPHIFERFFSQTYHGAGIGLSFCRMAMEKFGGYIQCESCEGHYTLFILTFPTLEKAHPTP